MLFQCQWTAEASLSKTEDANNSATTVFGGGSLRGRLHTSSLVSIAHVVDAKAEFNAPWRK